MQPEDMNKAILHLTEAVLLSLPPLTDSDVRTCVVFCFFQLARSLFSRFHLKHQPEDLKHSVDYFRHLYHSDLRLRVDPFDIPRSQIIIEFAKALRTYVELEVSSAAVKRSIEEVVALCRELLISGILGDDLADAIGILTGSCYAGLKGRHGKVIDQVVEHIRETIPRCPTGSHRVSSALAQILAARSQINFSIMDSQEAIALFDKIAASQPLGDKTNPSQSDALLWAARVAETQFTFDQRVETLEGAISRVRTALADSSLEDNLEPFQYLEKLMKARIKCFHLTEHPQMVSPGPAQEAAPSSLQQMSAPDEGSIGWDATLDVREACSKTTIEHQIQILQDLISSVLPGTTDHGKYLEALGKWYRAKFNRTGDTEI